MYRSAFPDLNLKVDDLVSAGDKVLIRWTGRGTHRGPFMGQQPTGRQTTTQGMTVATLRNGKIIEDWTQWDALGLLQALGMAPQLDQGAQAAP
jgi:predicted ester cyclase